MGDFPLQFRMQGVVGHESPGHRHRQKDKSVAGDGVGQQGLEHVAPVLGGVHSLYRHLVGSEGQGTHHGAAQQHPDGALHRHAPFTGDELGVWVAGALGYLGRGQRPDLGRIELDQKNDGDHEVAAHEYHVLHHVGPDDGPHPAQHGIEGPQQADRQQAQTPVETAYRFKSLGSRDQGGGEPEDGPDDEQRGSNRADAGMIPPLQIFVDRQHSQAGPDRNPHGSRRQHHQELDKAPRNGAAGVPFEDPTGKSQVADRAQVGCNERNAHRPPGHIAAGMKILLEACLPAREEDAHDHHRGQVDPDDQVVEDGELGHGRKHTTLHPCQTRLRKPSEGNAGARCVQRAKRAPGWVFPPRKALPLREQPARELTPPHPGWQVGASLTLPVGS